MSFIVGSLRGGFLRGYRDTGRFRLMSSYVEGGQKFNLIDKRPRLFREKPLTFFNVLAVTSAGIYCGALAAKQMAHFLEDNEIFAPDDDDDDD